jgi:ABC-2 type transport system permease protein
MKQLSVIAYYEIRRLLRHKSVTTLVFVLPLLIIFILGTNLSVFFVQSRLETGTIRLALLLEDRGGMKDSLLQLLEGEEARDIQVITVSDRKKLANLLESGQADVGVVLPSGFSEGLRQGNKPQWEFVDGSNLLKNVVSLQLVYLFFDQWNHSYAISGTWSNGSPPMEPEPFRDFSASKDEIKLTGWSRTSQSYSAVQYYSAHMLVMFMLYMGMASSQTLVTSKGDHSLARLQSMPLPAWKLLAGKMAGHTIITLIQASLILAGTSLLFHVSWGNSLLRLTLILALIMLFTLSLSAAVGMVLRTNRGVMVFYQVIIMVMTFLSGGFTPTIGDTLSRFGAYTMSYHASRSILQTMLGAGSTSAQTQSLLFLALWAFSAAILALLVYRKAGYRE